VISNFHKDITIKFNGDKLEVVSSYNYLRLEFDYNYNRKSCVEKLVITNMKVLYYMENKCIKN
jgi:hypothetical protein